MVVATKSSCSLLFDLYPRIHVNRTLMISATKSRSNAFCWNPYEASFNGCSHQVMFGFHLTNTYYIYIYIYIFFYLYIFFFFFFFLSFFSFFFLKINISTYKSRVEIERENLINLHKTLPSRLVWRIRSHVYQAPRQAVASSLVLEVSFGSFKQSQQVWIVDMLMYFSIFITIYNQ